MAPDSPTLVDIITPAYKRLIDYDFSPDEVIPLVEAIFASPIERGAIGDLCGDNAQIFIDVVHEVRSTLLHFRGAIV